MNIYSYIFSPKCDRNSKKLEQQISTKEPSV